MKLRLPSERKRGSRAVNMLGMEGAQGSEQGEPFNPFVQGRKELERYKRKFSTEPKPDKTINPSRFSQWAEGLSVAAVDAQWVEELRQDRPMQEELLDFARGYYLIGDKSASSSKTYFRDLALLSQVCPGIQVDPLIQSRIRKFYSKNRESWINLLGDHGPEARVQSYPLLAAAMQLMPDQQRVITQAFLDKGKARFMETLLKLVKEKEYLVLLMAAQGLLIDPDMRSEVQSIMEPYWPWVNQTLQGGSLPELFLATSILGAERAWVDQAGQIQLKFKPRKTAGKPSMLPERNQM